MIAGATGDFLGSIIWGSTSTMDRASAALEVVRRGHPPVDVVLTDLAMPDMDGLQLAAALRAFDQRLPVVAMSGDRHRHLQTLSDAKDFAAVLEKPCEFTVMRNDALARHLPAPPLRWSADTRKPWPVSKVQTAKPSQLNVLDSPVKA